MLACREFALSFAPSIVDLVVIVLPSKPTALVSKLAESSRDGVEDQSSGGQPVTSHCQSSCSHTNKVSWRARSVRLTIHGSISTNYWKGIRSKEKTLLIALQGRSGRDVVSNHFDEGSLCHLSLYWAYSVAKLTVGQRGLGPSFLSWK